MGMSFIAAILFALAGILKLYNGDIDTAVACLGAFFGWGMLAFKENEQ